MPTHRAIAWVTLGMAICSALIVFISLFVLCEPLPATWTGEGTCASPATLAILSYFVSASSLVTDLVCAVLPGFMLYKTQMKLATRVSVAIMLGVGAMCVLAIVSPWFAPARDADLEQSVRSYDHTNAVPQILFQPDRGLSM